MAINPKLEVVEDLRKRLDGPDERVILRNYQPDLDVDITDTVKDLIDSLDQLYWAAGAVVAEDEDPAYMKKARRRARELLEAIGHDV